MAIQNAEGDPLSKTAFEALLTDVPPITATVDEDVYQTYNFPPYDGTQTPLSNRFADYEGERRLIYKAGQVIDKSDVDALYPTATVLSVSPATGPAAGGTVVVVTGTNLSGATGVTFGGTAGTAFSVLGQNQVKVTTPAKTAGAYNVVVADDSGNLTLTNGFTYT
ncbi:MAG: IPT/TIG domain-containing protein [Pseudonocardiaceae bacterium]